MFGNLKSGGRQIPLATDHSPLTSVVSGR